MHTHAHICTHMHAHKCMHAYTKYRCLLCEKPVCDICSRNVDESIPGYDEEDKRVGICQSCDSIIQISFTMLYPPHDEPRYESEEKSDLSDDKIILVRQNSFSSVAEPSRKKQKTLDSMFLSSSKKDKHKTDTACQTLLIFFIKGAQNYKRSAIVDHAKNKNNKPLLPHTVAFKLFLETSKMSLETKSKLLATSGGKSGNTDVISSLKKISPETLEGLKKKFQTTYFTIKNELPISACKNILKLESLHGVDIGNK